MNSIQKKSLITLSIMLLASNAYGMGYLRKSASAVRNGTTRIYDTWQSHFGPILDDNGTDLTNDNGNIDQIMANRAANEAAGVNPVAGDAHAIVNQNLVNAVANANGNPVAVADAMNQAVDALNAIPAPATSSLFQRSTQPIINGYNWTKDLVVANPKKSALIAAGTVAAAGALAYTTSAKVRSKVNSTATRAKSGAQNGVNSLRSRELTKGDLARLAGLSAAGLGAFKLINVAKGYANAHDVQGKVKAGYNKVRAYTGDKAKLAWNSICEHKKATAAVVGGAVIAGTSYALYNKFYNTAAQLTPAQKAYQAFQDSFTLEQREAIVTAMQDDQALLNWISVNDPAVAIELLQSALFVSLLDENQKTKLAHAAALATQA